MAYEPLIPARLAFTESGVPFSPAYGDVYHSADGGLEQARHVFLQGNGLPECWQGRQQFVILETGFGLGLNFLTTWQAWRADPRRCPRLHFVSLEKHPFAREDLRRLHQAWPELGHFSEELLAQWPPLTPGAHRLLLDGGRITLTLFFGDAESLVRKIRLRADALFLDGFAPAKNPVLWQPVVLKALSRLCAPGASLATWSVSVDVREALTGLRWQLEKCPGFGRKREMLRGRLSGESMDTEGERRAVVIGAGIAGCATAERLAARGWEVLVLERHAGPASEASGNPAAILQPMMARDDNIAARFSRTGYLHALRMLRQLVSEGAELRWQPCGVLQLARDVEQEAAQREVCELLDFPVEYVEFLDRRSAESKVGHRLPAGGWHYPAGGWVVPADLCRALLERHKSVAAQYGAEVAMLQRADQYWRLLDEQGRQLASASVVVLANAHTALSLVPQLNLPLSTLRGQVSLLPAGTLPFLGHVLSGNGYVTPDDIGTHSLGATYDFGDADPVPRSDSHLINLAHLSALLPGVSVPAIDHLGARVAFRTMTLDRLPLIGPLPDSPLFTGRREAGLREINRLPGLHALLGLGSRGLIWAPLGAELLAARLTGDPLPLEADLADATDPARFALRAHRRNNVLSLPRD